MEGGRRVEGGKREEGGRRTVKGDFLWGCSRGREIEKLHSSTSDASQVWWWVFIG